MQEVGEDIEISREQLGSGTFAMVYSGLYKGKEVAIKKVPLSRIDQNDDPEVQSMKKLDHPNVLKMLACRDDDYFRLEILKILVYISIIIYIAI